MKNFRIDKSGLAGLGTTQPNRPLFIGINVSNPQCLIHIKCECGKEYCLNEEVKDLFCSWALECVAEDGKEIERVKKILRKLPKIEKIIRRGKGRHLWSGGMWEELKPVCEPLGLVDTAFKSNPTLVNYLISEKYWEERLGKLEAVEKAKQEIRKRIEEAGK